MKNLHILKTNKPSRLFLNKINNKLLFLKNETRIDTASIGQYQHIYITSDEEIKEGNWVVNTKGANEIYKVASFNGGVPLDKDGNGGLFTKKIILTDNKDLIKDGVQAIDDDFLEWFVKNSSCEFVEMTYENDTDLFGYDFCYYKILHLMFEVVTRNYIRNLKETKINNYEKYTHITNRQSE